MEQTLLAVEEVQAVLVEVVVLRQAHPVVLAALMAVAVAVQTSKGTLTITAEAGPEVLALCVLCGPVTLVASHQLVRDHLNFLEIT